MLTSTQNPHVLEPRVYYLHAKCAGQTDRKLLACHCSASMYRTVGRQFEPVILTSTYPISGLVAGKPQKRHNRWKVMIWLSFKHLVL